MPFLSTLSGALEGYKHISVASHGDLRTRQRTRCFEDKLVFCVGILHDRQGNLLLGKENKGDSKDLEDEKYT